MSESTGVGNSINTIARSIDGNTRAVEAIDRRLETLTRTTEANARAIADLTSSVTGLRLPSLFQGLSSQTLKSRIHNPQSTIHNPIALDVLGVVTGSVGASRG